MSAAIAASQAPQELDVFACALDGVNQIEASAGTGKTWNICALYVRLLLEHDLQADQILVVTFTKAATAELHERIRGRLAQLAHALETGDDGGDPFVARLFETTLGEGSDGDGDDGGGGIDAETAAKRIRRALRGFDQAAIHTIHAFCQRALQEAPFAAAMPFAFEMEADDAALRDTAVLQPYLFTLEYALGMLLIEMGLPVAAAAGHSLGEYVAATLAGVFELDDAVRIVAARARIMSRAPRGAMLAVLCDEARVAEFLGPEISLCTVNSESSCVLGGSEAAIDALAARLADAKLASVRLPTSHAFHSHLMTASSLEFAAAFDGVTLHPPRFPIAANLDGRADRPERFATPDYWVGHLRGTVRFRDCLATLAEQVPFGAWVEAGPGKSLVNALARALPAEVAPFPTLLPGAEATRFDTLVGQCWVNGMEIDWRPLYGELRGKVVALPAHPLDEVRCWIDAPAARPAVDAAPEAYRKQDDLDAWLYEYEWAEAAPARAGADDATAGDDAAPLLLIGDGGAFANRLARRLARHAPVTVLDDFVMGEA
ncbi:acyltransferase domain-containing protein, partial [Burkholderia sp. Cy-647]|uniref:acyltransferase domain-containing protein n=1 Tax=Burkholderia sp. Cy-647 TaxID=2608328 RepID=UPI001F03B9DA